MPDTAGASSVAELWVKIVQAVGFPVVVAGVLLWFLLTQVVPGTTKLAEAMQDMRVAIAGLQGATAAQTKAYETLEGAVRKSVDTAEDNNQRLQQMMGERPWPPRR